MKTWNSAHSLEEGGRPSEKHLEKRASQWGEIKL
jgi:hypothetical protein